MARIQLFQALILYFSIAFRFTFSFPTRTHTQGSLELGSFNETLNVQQPHVIRSHYLSKRTPPGYDESIQRGHQFLCRLSNPFLGNDQSQYTTVPSLANSGWTRTVDLEVQTNSILEFFKDAFDTLHITDYEQAQGIQWTNSMPSVNMHGINVDATGAFFSNIYDPGAGFIIAGSNYGPNYMTGGTLPPNGYPNVKAWSDVVFVEWKIQALARQEDVKNLKFVFRYEIINSETKDMIKASVADESELDWPGVDIPMDNPAAEAILGSPNGRGVAWLLASHKLELGLKTVKSVWVWSESIWFYAIFELEDIPDDDSEGLE